MTLRRRFFPTQRTQQVPAPTVALEVQMRATPAQVDAPQQAAPTEPGAAGYALAWPMLSGPTMRWPYDYPPRDPEEALAVTDFSAGASGLWETESDWSGGAVLPFQLVSAPASVAAALPAGWSVSWALVNPDPTDAPGPVVSFDPLTGRGYVDMRVPDQGTVPSWHEFFFELRLSEGEDVRGRLTVIKAGGGSYPYTPYGRVGWYAWA